MRPFLPLCFAVLASCSCAGEAERPPVAGVLHLVDHLRAPGGAPVVTTRHTLRGIGRETVTADPPAPLTASVVVPEEGVLRFAVSLTGPGTGNVAEVAVRSGRAEETLWAERVEKRKVWLPASVALSEYAGRRVEIILRTTEPDGAQVLWGSPVVSGQRDNRLDVMLYEVDTQRADLLEPFGFPGPSSPVAGALARQGVTFTECFSTSSWTRPAATSILTSLSAPAHGVIGEEIALPAQVITLTDVLRDRGWYTVAFQTNPHAGRPAGLDEGFDEVFEMAALVESLLRNRDAWQGSPTIGTSSASGTTELVALLLQERLPEWAGLPLFLYLHTLDPHTPYDPRAPFSVLPGFEHEETRAAMRSDRETYGRDVRAADHFLGEIRRTMEREDRFDRSIMAFVSDHGEEFGEHGGSGHGRTLFDEQLRVPFLLVAPGVLPRGRVVRERVSTLDLLPTLLDILDEEIPAGVEGRSLLARIQTVRPGLRFPEDPVFSHVVSKGVRFDPPAMNDPAVVGHIAMGRGPWKCIVAEYGTRRRRRAALYDLRTDPRETMDLSAARPELLAEMRDAALGWWEARKGRGSAIVRPPDAESAERLRALGYVD